MEATILQEEKPFNYLQHASYDMTIKHYAAPNADNRQKAIARLAYKLQKDDADPEKKKLLAQKGVATIVTALHEKR